MQDVLGRVAGVVRTCLETDTVDPGVSFAALGADSLDLLALSCRLEEEFGRDIPDAWMGPDRTARDVAAYLRGGRAGHPLVR